MSGPCDDRPPGPAPPQDESNPGEEITGKDPTSQVPRGWTHTVMQEIEEEKHRDADDRSQRELDAKLEDDVEELLKLQHDLKGMMERGAPADEHHSDLLSVLSKGSFDCSDLNAVPEPKHDQEVQRPAAAEIREFLQQTQLRASRVSPEELLRENVRTMDAQIEAVQAQSDMAPKAQIQKLQSLRLKRRASKSELAVLMLRKASERVQESMQNFHAHVLEYPSQWAVIQDIPNKMAAALNDYPPYKLSMHEFMSHEIHDAHARSIRDTLLRELANRAEHIIHGLHNHVVQQDQALDMEMIRMQAHIQQLQQFTEDGEKRSSVSERKQVTNIMYSKKNQLRIRDM